jgi:PurA ssDNA and RNA-binding protein
MRGRGGSTSTSSAESLGGGGKQQGGHGAPNFGKECEVMINSNTAHGSSDPLASEKIQVDRKVFFLDLKENQRGRFLKITEDVSGRRDTIMLPASALKDFVSALSRLVDLEERL